jgi:hypothetical protein
MQVKFLQNRGKLAIVVVAAFSISHTKCQKGAFWIFLYGMLQGPFDPNPLLLQNVQKQTIRDILNFFFKKPMLSLLYT